MLWLLAGMLSVSPATPGRMKLTFSSPDYSIQTGEALIFRSDGSKPCGAEIPLTDGTIARSPNVPPAAQPFLITRGVISNVPISGPGRCAAMLWNLQVLRLSDEKKFHIGFVLVNDFVLTESDLERGSAEIPIPRSGVFRVVVRKADQTPLAHQTLRVIRMHGPGFFLEGLQAITDQNGEITMFGRPADYAFQLAPAGAKGVWIQIFPL